MITRLPGLVTVSSSDLSTEELDLIGAKLGEATDVALAQLRQMRMTEGQSLMADIDRRDRQHRSSSADHPGSRERLRGALPAAAHRASDGTGAAARRR